MVKHLKRIDFRLIYGTARACHKQDGIRGSKDLRAEVMKYLISTNERKKMSLLTIRKRIALVAVTALTAGVLSVATSPVANAAAGDITWMYNQGTSGVCAVYNNSAGAYVALTGSTVSTLASTRTVTVALGGAVTLAAESTFTTFSSNGVVTAPSTAYPSEQVNVAVGGA